MGSVTYANASANATAKRFKVNARTGRITVPKGTRKGTYNVRVKVTATGNACYTAKTQTVSFRIRVR
jgi:hypothetical protein